MRKALVAALVAIVFIGVAPLPSAAQTSAAPSAVSALTVVSDAPDAGPFFDNFFRKFNGTLLQWWQNEGRVNTKRKWTVLVSEYQYYEANLKLRGVMMTLTDSGSLQIMAKIEPILWTESEALRAAYVIIAGIETIEEVDGR